MNIKEIYEKLLGASRPIEFFGNISDVKQLKSEYKNYARKLHPDLVTDEDKYLADESFIILNRLYNLGLDELEKGIYDTYDPIKIYEHIDPMFEINIKGETYKFYENVFEGEVGSIFKGISSDKTFYLKVANDPEDNDLIDNEYEILSRLRHQSFPYVTNKIMINDTNAILMREVKGVTVEEILNKYPSGVPAEHVMWMLERLLSACGYLHANYVVHGNIKPENIIINKETHNVSLVGFSFCVQNANTKSARYKIVNDYYTAPEVNKDALVNPSSDIFSIGKIAIKLLGGDVSSCGMPICIDERVRTFIRQMVNTSIKLRPNDAWKLWSELIELRTEVFGTKRFQKFD